MVDDRQTDVPVDEGGLLSTRQELIGWAYNEQGEPQAFGGVTLDCIRMTLYNFALSATAMTAEERAVSKLPEGLKPAEVMKRIGTPEFVELYLEQQQTIRQIEMKEEREPQEERKKWSKFMGRPVRHRRRSS